MKTSEKLASRPLYPKSGKYTDLGLIYSECSGPGGLQLTEFLAEKMRLRSGARLLDIGIERGYQTCFLAREFDLLVIAAMGLRISSTCSVMLVPGAWKTRSLD
jgi:hypothetical protein